MTLRAVIFDFGGVLMRTQDSSPRRSLAQRLGVSLEALLHLVFESESARLATLGQISTWQHWENVRLALGLPPDQAAEVASAFWSGDALDTDLIAYLRRLRPRYRTALLSNAWDDLRNALRHQWNIEDAFDEVIISAEVGLAKPDPRIYQLALMRLGVMPNQAVFVDDFVENVIAARSVGMQAIHFRDPSQVRSELAQMLDSQQP